MTDRTFPVSELAAFHQFVGEQLLQQGFAELTPEESVEQFRVYRLDLERLQRDLAPALEQVQRGEAVELNVEQLLVEGRQRLAERGIVD